MPDRPPLAMDPAPFLSQAIKPRPIEAIGAQTIIQTIALRPRPVSNPRKC